MKTNKDKKLQATHHRAGLVYLAFLLLSIAIIYKLFYFNYVIGNELREKAEKMQEQRVVIPAKRGKILGAHGEILAVSIPSYNIYLDLHSNKPDSLFYKHIDSLSFCLSNLFKDRTAAQYKRVLQKGRKDKKKGGHYFLKRNVSQMQLEALKNFPLLNLGKYVGGLIPEKRMIRRMPYGSLAKRTVGVFNREKQKYEVGLEGAFDSILQGTDGVRHLRKAERGEWISIAPAQDTMPQNGLDIVSTIDVEIQDIAERALMEQVVTHGARKGCVIVMEVATGEIKAIANLGRDENNKPTENYNFAIADGTNPGSTFKAVSMLAALNDGVVKMNDTIVTGRGFSQFCRRTIRDTHVIGNGRISLTEVISHSSNVGIAKIIYSNYQNQPQRFLDQIYAMNMNDKTGISLAGEKAPYIRNTEDKFWSCTSIPWMAYGYEMQITPLQMLCFYNTIANNGKRMKPMLVKAIRNEHELIQSFEPVVINEQIASPNAIKDLQYMLKEVVQNGTGKKLKDMAFTVAGKTGTAQLPTDNKGFNKQRNNYQSSFVGYFPADNPKYSCIAVISNTTSGSYYGGTVALPVFKAIANRLYTRDLDTGLSNPQQDRNYSAPNLWYKVATQADYTTINQNIGIGYTSSQDTDNAYMICMQNKQKQAVYQARPIDSTKVPKLIGMTATDAVYLCENLGTKVELKGNGFVTTQSPNAGTPIGNRTTIRLILSE